MFYFYVISDAQLMNKKDAENADNDYAFDNPAFKGKCFKSICGIKSL